MSDFNIETVPFKLNKAYRFQWEEAQHCYVLLYPEGLIKLGESAAEIIQRCTEKTTFSAIVAELKNDFPDAENLTDDVRGFLQDAAEQDWITPSISE